MRPPSDQLLELIDRAKQLIYDQFEIQIDVTIPICSVDEMTTKLKNIYATKAPTVYRKIEPLIPFMEGKFFKEDREIWLIERIGENLATIVHEMLHSIQECDSTHREPIVHYLTYKLTGDKTGIYEPLIEDWQEIERMYNIKRILKRLISKGDCEDF